MLRGDLAAILTFASGKKKPGFLNEQGILEDLMGRAGANEGQKRQKPHEGALMASQEWLVAGARFNEWHKRAVLRPSRFRIGKAENAEQLAA